MTNTITLRVDADTMKRITGMSMAELEQNEGDIDHALLSEMQTEFPDADVNASSFYVSDVEVEAYDDNGEPITVDSGRINAVIERALKSI